MRLLSDTSEFGQPALRLKGTLSSYSFTDSSCTSSPLKGQILQATYSQGSFSLSRDSDLHPHSDGQPTNGPTAEASGRGLGSRALTRAGQEPLIPPGHPNLKGPEAFLPRCPHSAPALAAYIRWISKQVRLTQVP